MKNTHCLSEQELILHYYKELPLGSQEILHLNDCPACKERFADLCNDMSLLPDMPHTADHLSGTRMAARVTEQLKQPRGRWLPTLGTSAVAAIALVLTISTWSPQQELEQTAHLSTSGLTANNLFEEIPDIDFLEDLELLRELELLSQLEGV